MYKKFIPVLLMGFVASAGANIDKKIKYYDNDAKEYRYIELANKIADKDGQLQLTIDVAEQQQGNTLVVKSYEHKLANRDHQPIISKIPPPAEPLDTTPR